MPSSSDPRSSAATTPKTVLIVEDNDDLRILFRDALKYAGFRVIDVSDGPAALRILDDVSAHVIVLDLRLPTLDGYSVRAELAAHALTRDIPVVVVTASEADLRRLEPACVLRKPVDLTELVSVVRRCLAAKRGGDGEAR